MSCSRRAVDRGSGTVLAITVVLVILAAGGLAAALAQAVEVRHRAAVAADAGAIAAASRLADGTSGACAVAARVVSADRADLQSCTAVGSVVTVTVQVAAKLPWLGPVQTVRLNARAGPAETFGEKPAPVVPAS
jgi:secretion/DNA translocation related TadE-like protein